MSMSPDQLHGAGLWAFFPLLFHTGHLGPDLHVVERFVQDAVAVEVDLPAVRYAVNSDKELT